MVPTLGFRSDLISSFSQTSHFALGSLFLKMPISHPESLFRARSRSVKLRFNTLHALGHLQVLDHSVLVQARAFSTFARANPAEDNGGRRCLVFFFQLSLLLIANFPFFSSLTIFWLG
jgi:hypothetical protein